VAPLHPHDDDSVDDVVHADYHNSQVLLYSSVAVGVAAVLALPGFGFHWLRNRCGTQIVMAIGASCFCVVALFSALLDDVTLRHLLPLLYVVYGAGRRCVIASACALTCAAVCIFYCRFRALFVTLLTALMQFFFVLFACLVSLLLQRVGSNCQSYFRRLFHGSRFDGGLCQHYPSVRHCFDAGVFSLSWLLCRSQKRPPLCGLGGGVCVLLHGGSHPRSRESES